MKKELVGYFIDPNATPLARIDWVALKASGISEVYVRAQNKGVNSYANLKPYYSKMVDAGLKPYAWIWQGFSHTKEVADMGYHIVFDLETYKMADYMGEVKQVRKDCNGKTFVICTKPEEWDGPQRWDLLAPLCDYLMPMLYVGDYNKSVAQLEAFTRKYNAKYPGKIYPALETYVSDKNTVPKTNAVLNGEISAIKPYVEGIALFRYGISKY